jgi:hypothetical protein
LLADLLVSELDKTEGLKASSEIAKQIIALSTGAVAFTVTFLDKFTSHASDQIKIVPKSLYVAWTFFGLAILAALWTLMSITGTLDALDRKANGWSLTDAQQSVSQGASSNVRLPATIMLAMFMLAIIAMIWTGARLTTG